MPYDTELADRVRAYLADATAHAVTEKEMFGGIAFLVDDKMCVNVSGDTLMCRVDPDRMGDLAERQGFMPMVMRGKALDGYCRVSPEGFASRKDFAFWIDECLAYNPRAKPSRTRKASVTRRSVLLSIVLGVVCGAWETQAQTPSQDRGRFAGKAVAALDGDPLKGVSVEIVPKAGGKKVSRKTKADGRFQFEGLLSGPYRLTASVPGFVLYEQDVDVAAGELLMMDVRLAVGRLQETMTLEPSELSRPEEERSYFDRVDIEKRKAMKERLLAPTPIRRVYPDYTRTVKHVVRTGTVHVEGTIEPTGRVTRLHVVSSPDERLSALALDALQGWLYEPTRLSGVPIAVQGTFIFHFQ